VVPTRTAPDTASAWAVPLHSTPHEKTAIIKRNIHLFYSNEVSVITINVKFQWGH
jgi:hypothetical protein